MYKLIFIFLISLSILHAKSEVYFLPQEGKSAKQELMSLIEQSQKNIHVAMYNFSYKKFAKALISASKRGVKVEVFFDASKVKKDDAMFKYLRKKGIFCKILDKKNHLKVALFDNHTAIFGSANWTKDSFGQNYELLYLTDKKSVIKKLSSIFKSLNNN